MKRFIFAVAIVMACIFVAGGASARTFDKHVTTAPNGKGDLLIYPVYMASEGIETKLTVINTSLTECVVAKLVVKSQVYSEEVLDFLLYLSPTDMWIGTIKYDKDGKNPIMISTDLSGPTFPEGGQPLAPADCSGDTNLYGYVEVIEAWSTIGLGGPPVDKKKIKDAYDAWNGGTPAVTVNTLAGSYMISVPDVGWEAEDNAVAFRDYDNLTYLNPAVVTILGDLAENNTHELDAAFNKNSIAMAYNSSTQTGGTLHLFTFPTKQSYDYDTKTCSRASKYSPFFPADGKVVYKMRVQDNEERTTVDPDDPFSPVDKPVTLTMNDELNIKDVLKNGVPFFNFGWINYTFNVDSKNTTSVNLGGETLTYTGAPVIPVIVDFNEGLSIRTAAWTDGTVKDGSNNVILDYQYSAATAVTK